jgi:hypothetical protein
MKKLFVFLTLFVSVSLTFALNVSFTGYVKSMQSVPLQNYHVFFRFTVPAYLPAEFSMNGPVIQTDNNGRYTFTLNNIPSGVNYYAKIYVYDNQLNRVEKTFSFYVDGCDYNVSTIYATPITSLNTSVNFSHQAICPDCPAAQTLSNTSTPNLQDSPLTQWEWKANGHIFSEQNSTTHFISNPQQTTVSLSATLIDPYTDFAFVNIVKSRTLTQDTAFFFHAGGQVFSGAMPVTTSGVVLYRKILDNYEAVDTMIVSTYGYYYFADLPSCSYIVKAFPDPDQIKSEYYLPTYFPDVASWALASVITKNNATSTMSVQMLASSTATGNKSIAGSVVYPDYTPVVRCELLLFDNNTEPIHYCMSDDQGEFLFENLPNGTYYIVYDIPGHVPQLQQIVLSDTNPHAQTQIVVGTVSSVYYIVEENSAQVFPNPFYDELSVRFSPSTFGDDKTLSIRTMNGALVYCTSVPGSENFTMNLSSLASGMYLLEVFNHNSLSKEALRIIKR